MYLNINYVIIINMNNDTNMFNNSIINSLMKNEFNDDRTFDIHLRIQQRNGKKCITIVENLDKIDSSKEFMTKISKSFKEKFHCASTIKDTVIQLSGDHRDGIKKLLLSEKYVTEDQIKIHGG